MTPGVFRVVYLDAHRLAVRLGGPDEPTACFVVDGDEVEPLDGVRDVGRSASRRWFARVRADAIEVSDGWDGPRRRFRLPDHHAPIHEAEALAGRQLAVGSLGRETVEVFDDGERVVLGTSRGVFVCYPDRDAITIWPPGSRLAAATGAPVLGGAHGAVSPDGRVLVVGDETSDHVLLIREPTTTRTLTAEPALGAPDLARFHDHHPLLALATRDDGDGAVVQLALDALDRAGEDRDDPGDEPIVLADGPAVLAIAPRDDGWLLGDRAGGLRWVGLDGAAHGALALAAACRAIDVAPDGRRAAVGTAAGELLEVEGVGAGARVVPRVAAACWPPAARLR